MKIKIMKTALSVAVLAATISTTNSTWALGTTAGTDIDNTASIDYSVGGTNQTDIYSSPTGNSLPGVPGSAGAPTVAATNTTFVVDKKIDLSVTPPVDLNVTPGATAQVLTFQITNDGNSPENFSMTASDIAGGDFDATACVVAPTTFTALAVDTATNVTVTCTIPNSGTTANGGTAGAGLVANTKTSLIDLLAEVTGVTNDSGIVDDAAVVETVFADDTGTATDGADENAKHSAAASYIINTAELTIKKTSAVTKMVVNGVDVTTNQKRIPGATIEYTIVVTNDVLDGTADAATATGIVISDLVDANLENITATITGGTSTSAPVTGQNVASTAFDLAAGETATLTITATVK
jgi:uncharacterized repeat protein (TIGR01451 family)